MLSIGETIEEREKEKIRKAIKKEGIKKKDLLVVHLENRCGYRILVNMSGYWNEENCISNGIRRAIKELGYEFLKDVEGYYEYMQFDVTKSIN